MGMGMGMGLGRCAVVGGATGRGAHGLVEVVEHGDGVVGIELNAPKSLNALTVAMGEDLGEVVSSLQASDSPAKAVVVTGRGRAFSAGGDLGFLTDRGADRPDSNTAHMMAFYKAFLAIRGIPVPVLAAINGHAVGAGCCFAMAADVRIVHAQAKLGFNFARIGLHPGMGATHFLPKLIGMQAASQLLLTGELVPGTKAAELGMAAQVVDAAEDPDSPIGPTYQAAIDMARVMATETSPLTSRQLVKTLRAKIDVGLEEALMREADCQAHSYGSDEYHARLAALIARTSSSAK